MTDEQCRLYNEATVGGPGLDGYAYQADTYCPQCGMELCWRLAEAGELAEPDSPEFSDSDHQPQPIFFGESDHPTFCALCEEHLYGEEPE